MSLSCLFERRCRGIALAVATLLLAVSGAAGALEIKVLSSGPDYVSGDDALVQVKPQTIVGSLTPTVLVNGANQSANFTDAGGGKWVGMVSGLQLSTTLSPKPNTVSASYGSENASLALANYPNEGPIISGVHETPFICTTDFSKLPGSPLLIRKNDGFCGLETHYAYFTARYNTTAKEYVFSPFNVNDAYPPGIAKITVNGQQKNFVVRVETGAVNRAIYQIAMLHDVKNDPAVPTRTAPSVMWNGKLVYQFGGGCENGWYQQGLNVPDVLDGEALSKRYAVASSSLNEMRQNCNDLLSSETLMMVKEKFIETYGLPKYTIGKGGSGGSYQANQTADNYPGLLDGIITSQTFADVNTTTMFKLFDSRLLREYFKNNPNINKTDDQRKAISGYSVIGNVNAMSDEAVRIDPAGDFAPHIENQISQWSPGNMTGARASVYDHTRNVYGVDGSNYGNWPISNVGVQYGLKALLDGKIDGAEFVHLNKNIGGLNNNLKGQAARTTGDPGAIARAYRSGRFLNGGGGLQTTPIIDKRDYNDKSVDIHASIHSFAVRERLRKYTPSNELPANHIIRRSSGGGDFGTVNALDRMGEWLDAIVADAAPLTYQKVKSKKPTELKDGCKLKNDKVTIETQRPFAGTCAGATNGFPVAFTPRIAAGGLLNKGDATLDEAVLRDNIALCRLRPPVLGDYKGKLNEAQLNDLKATVFSGGGVCDWKNVSGGDGEQPLQTWSSFGPSPVNRIPVP